MNTAHVYFADMPLTSDSRDGRSTLDSFNDDAIIRQCSARDHHNISPNSSDSPTPRYERNMGFFRQLSRRFGLRSNDDLVFTGSNDDDNQSSSTDSYNSQTAVGKEKDNQPRSSLAAAIGAEYISCASSETSSTIDIDEQQQHLQQQQQHVNEDYDDNDKAINTGSDADANVDVKYPYNKDRKSFTRSSFSRLQRRSTSSIRRAFEAFSLSSRSLSCSGATPPPPPPMSTTSSASSSSTNNGTPIKSALKSSSNLELNKKSSSAASASTTNRCYSLSCSSSTSLCKSSSKTKTKPPPQRILRQPVSYTYLKGISGLPTQRVPRSSVCCQYARR